MNHENRAAAAAAATGIVMNSHTNPYPPPPTHTQALSHVLTHSFALARRYYSSSIITLRSMRSLARKFLSLRSAEYPTRQLPQ